MKTDRICCDSRCVKDRACPLTANLRATAATQRLAPGAIDGPYSRPSQLRRILAALLAQLWHAGGCR